MQTKYIFVTGGVVSSLGKGIISASIGKLLQARGYKVTIQKFDPYINIDPGTLNPYEHGECYVTEDGFETDLDLGHYERFTGIHTTRNNSITTGRIYKTVIDRERRGDYLGKTIQVVPHITDEIKRRMINTSPDLPNGEEGLPESSARRFSPPSERQGEVFDFVITEVGGMAALDDLLRHGPVLGKRTLHQRDGLAEHRGVAPLDAFHIFVRGLDAGTLLVYVFQVRIYDRRLFHAVVDDQARIFVVVVVEKISLVRLVDGHIVI